MKNAAQKIKRGKCNTKDLNLSYFSSLTVENAPLESFSQPIRQNGACRCADDQVLNSLSHSSHSPHAQPLTRSSRRTAGVVIVSLMARVTSCHAKSAHGASTSGIQSAS